MESLIRSKVEKYKAGRTSSGFFWAKTWANWMVRLDMADDLSDFIVWLEENQPEIVDRVLAAI